MPRDVRVEIGHVQLQLWSEFFGADPDGDRGDALALAMWRDLIGRKLIVPESMRHETMLEIFNSWRALIRYYMEVS